MEESSSVQSFIRYVQYESAKFSGIILAMDRYYEDGMGDELETDLNNLKELLLITEHYFEENLYVNIKKGFSQDEEFEKKYTRKKILKFINYVVDRTKYFIDNGVYGKEKDMLNEFLKINGVVFSENK